MPHVGDVGQPRQDFEVRSRCDNGLGLGLQYEVQFAPWHLPKFMATSLQNFGRPVPEELEHIPQIPRIVIRSVKLIIYFPRTRRPQFADPRSWTS